MRSRSSRSTNTSKHFGCEMSSRLMPPKPGWIRRTVLIMSAADLVFSMMGTASTPPRYLNSSALPSITGRPALGPMSPRPSPRVPSETTATVLPLLVCS